MKGYMELLREKEALLKAVKQFDLDCLCCKNNVESEHASNCGESDFMCSECKLDCVCRSCRDNSNYEFDFGKFKEVE